MLQKVLIANRGEIAVRVIRTCREMGVATVAVYSDLDPHAMHVRMADEAYALGGTSSRDSYLSIEALLGAIERSGADAVHPGYGFLSENPEFARAVTAAGVVFVGPPADAIEIMGDKMQARRTAEEAGVAGVPGLSDELTSAEQVVAFGEAHGWPVAVKAAHAGGGRGMRIASGPDEAAEALASAQREALAHFGRAECYVERYLIRPRHVEVQVMADTHGHTVSLGERDCSCQRRQQKLVEESPAPGLDEATRQAMGQAAVAVAERCGYVGAGTVEFLLEKSEPDPGLRPGTTAVTGGTGAEMTPLVQARPAFWFLEMNARLQVEHPVTELVTGLDLVELQLRVASGEALPFTQDEVRSRGHAIECRINAEDPAGGRFLPSPGLITTLRPAAGPGVRTDAGYEEGDEVNAFFDNLVAKLIVWAPDREAARRRMIRALGEMRVEGVVTTMAAHLAILSHPDFAAGEHSTSWVEDTLDLSAVQGDPGPAPADAGDTRRVQRDVDVEVDGRRYQVKLWVPDSGASAGPAGGGEGRRRRRRSSAGAEAGGPGTITAPMQGTVAGVLVEVGQEVEAGQPLLVLEAMKMENQIRAEGGGRVTEMRVRPGDTVGVGDILAIIE